MHDMRHLHQSQFNGKALVFRSFVIDITLARDIEPRQQQLRCAILSLCFILALDIVGYLHELHRARVLRDEQVADMFTQTDDKVMAIETLPEDLVEQQQRRRMIAT